MDTRDDPNSGEAQPREEPPIEPRVEGSEAGETGHEGEGADGGESIDEGETINNSDS